MVQVNIYYSLRKNENDLPSLRLFADELCARLDQEYFKYWDKPCYGSFVLDVKGTAYIDAVFTKEEYINELIDKNLLKKELLAELER